MNYFRIEESFEIKTTIYIENVWINSFDHSPHISTKKNTRSALWNSVLPTLAFFLLVVNHLSISFLDRFHLLDIDDAILPVEDVFYTFSLQE